MQEEYSFLYYGQILLDMRNFELLIPFQKTVDANGTLTLFGGIASSSDVDRDNERMDKGVLPKIASDLLKNSTVFFNHKTTELGVGIVKTAEVRNDEVHISVAPTKAPGMADVVMQIEEGLLKSFSIGGRIKKAENVFDEKLGKDVRTIKDVEVFEVSLVGIPSNTHATINEYISKSFDPGDILEKNGGPETSGLASGAKPDTEPILKAYDVKCHKCSTVMDKCFKCGTPLMHKEAEEHKEPDGDEKKEASIKEAAAKILDSSEFKKAFDGFKAETMAKQVELMEKNKSLEARVEILQKALDQKSESIAKAKGLDATDSDVGKKEEKVEKTTASEGFTFLRNTPKE
jgi:HK97 family phage prohead protease